MKNVNCLFLFLFLINFFNIIYFFLFVQSLLKNFILAFWVNIIQFYLVHIKTIIHIFFVILIIFLWGGVSCDYSIFIVRIFYKLVLYLFILNLGFFFFNFPRVNLGVLIYLIFFFFLLPIRFFLFPYLCFTYVRWSYQYYTKQSIYGPMQDWENQGLLYTIIIWYPKKNLWRFFYKFFNKHSGYNLTFKTKILIICNFLFTILTSINLVVLKKTKVFSYKWELASKLIHEKTGIGMFLQFFECLDTFIKQVVKFEYIYDTLLIPNSKIIFKGGKAFFL